MTEIDDIKSRILLSKEIGKWIKLKKKANLFWGVCPFHKEKTPSFSVNDKKNFFYCFGCGEGGDFFTFMKKLKGMSFREVIESLGYKTKGYIGQDPNTQLYDLMQKAAEFYSVNLEGQAYLENRGIKKQWIEKFQIGFSRNNEVINKLMESGFSIDKINISGIGAFGKDRFRNRVIFPIKTKQNAVIGFGGRTINDEIPKYLNSPETILFKKSLHLYGENFLQWNEPIILVEGYLDVIGLYQSNFINVVGTMGTSLSKENVYSLLKMTNKLFIMFDGDEAGERAVYKNLENILCCLQPDKEVFICSLKGEDPLEASFKGNFYVKEILANSIPLSRWISRNFFSNNETAEKYSYNLYKLNELLDQIQNPYVKKAFKTFFQTKLVEKKTLKITKLSKEEEIIGLFCLLREFWDLMIEEFTILEFSGEWQKTKNFILKVLEEKSAEESYEIIMKNPDIKTYVNKTEIRKFLINKALSLRYFFDKCKQYMENNNK